MIADDQIEVFHGRLTASEAHVFVRVRGTSEDLSIEGEVRGPFSEYGRTLPLTVPLVPDSTTGLFSARLPDPCFWSPDFPGLYRVKVTLQHGDCPPQAVERSLGLRFLGRQKQSLYWDQRRWVLRAATIDSQAELDWDLWRESRLSLFVKEPGEELCQLASKYGVPLVAAASSGSTATAIRTWLQHASVIVVCLPCATVVDSELLEANSSTLLVTDQAGPASWSEGRIVDWGENTSADAPLAILRRRYTDGGSSDPTSLRHLVDQLQADSVELKESRLVPFAGYIV